MKKNSSASITPKSHGNRDFRHTVTRYAAIATVAFLSACGGGGGSSDTTTGTTSATATVTLSASAPRTVRGRVLSSSTGSGVANARVTTQGVSATTDADGNYTLDNLVLDDQVLVSISANGFAPTTKVAFRGSTQFLILNASMLPISASQQVDPALGGTVNGPDSTAQVVFAPNSMARTDGSPISGDVKVDLTLIPVAVNSNWLPGDYTAMVAGQVDNIESFGAVTVTLTDAQGARVNLAPAQSATIRIPVSSRAATVPATASLYYFDESSGRWVEEGTATLVDAGGNKYYEGTVTHFTTWTAGQYPQTVQVTGCLADTNNTRIANGIIMSDGIDYSGTSSVRTDSNGNFSIPIRSASRATVTGQMNGAVTNTLNVGPSATTIELGTPCLTVPINNSGINIKLTWGSYPMDLDSHLYAPDGSHVYYVDKGSLTNAPYVNLDVDDTTSYGPEVVTYTKLQVGTYQYYVHNYSGTFAPGMTGSPARVELNVSGNVSLYSPPAAEGANRWWHVFDLTVDADCNITVTPAGTWRNSPPALSTTGGSYCSWVGSVPSPTPTTTDSSTTTSPTASPIFSYH